MSTLLERPATQLTHRNVPPEATKVLPAQSAERGILMPLHMASVLSWLCQDGTVQTRLGKSTAGCYQAIWPFVAACTAELQERVPDARNRTGDIRHDLIAFRSSVRSCLARHYVAFHGSGGNTTVQSIEVGQPDPLVAAMGASAIAETGRE